MNEDTWDKLFIKAAGKWWCPTGGYFICEKKLVVRTSTIYGKSITNHDVEGEPYTIL